MVTQRMTLVIEVPANQATDLSTAIARVTRQRGGQVVNTTTRRLSLELEALGINTQISHALVSLNIETVTKLQGCTEDWLLAQDGINYAGLRQIIRRLAAKRRRLKGSRAKLGDQIERLNVGRGTYRRLKRAGYHALSQVTALDQHELHRLLPSVSSEVARALQELGLTLVPFKPSHPIRVLSLVKEAEAALTAAGIDLDSPIGQLTASGLYSKLSASSQTAEPGSAAHRWVKHVRDTLTFFDYQLPE